MRIGAILRAPLLHFLLGGALLFAAGALLRGDDASKRPLPIAIDPARIDEIRREATARSGSAPTPAELERLVGLELDEELLFREALARGLDAGDPGIEARLAQKMLFLDESASTADAAALARRARELGLDREDFVVRRLLAEKLRLLATALDPDERPDEAALRRAHRERGEALRTPPRWSLVHVFVSRDRRGDGARAFAEALRRRIETQNLSPAEAIAEGDPFPFGPRLIDRTRETLARQLGDAFAEGVTALPVVARAEGPRAEGGWSAPIESAYGLHLVRVESFTPGEVPAFERVRERLRLELENERRERKLAALLAELRTRYEVASAGSGEGKE